MKNATFTHDGKLATWKDVCMYKYVDMITWGSYSIDFIINKVKIATTANLPNQGSAIKCTPWQQ